MNKNERSQEMEEKELKENPEADGSPESVSEEKLLESDEQAVEGGGEESESPEAPKEEEKPVDELTEWKQKFEEINDKYLRLYSEFDNFRKRTIKEKIEQFKTAGEDVIVSLLPVLDDFERALKSMGEGEENKAVKDGILLIHQKLQNILSQRGLKAIPSSVGNEFDTNLHEAVTRIPAEDKKMKGRVLDEVEKGYMLNDKVIRYTRVVVGE